MKTCESSGWRVGSLMTLILVLPVARSLFGMSSQWYAAPVVGLSCVLVFQLTIGRCSRPRTLPVAYALVILTLCGWLAASILWAAPPIHYVDELGLLGFLGSLAILATFLTDGWVVDKLLVLVAIAAVLVTGYVVWGYLTTGSLRGGGSELLAEQYLTISSFLGLGATTATLRFAAGGKKRWGLIGLVCFLGIGLSLARGALLSSILVVLVLVVAYTLTLRTGRGRHTIEGVASWGTNLWVLGLSGLAIGAALSVARTRARLRLLLLESDFGPRADMWVGAVEAIARKPLLGYGLGESGAVIGLSEEFYPHNLLLQFWLEGGFIPVFLGLLMLMIPLAVGIRKGMDYRSGPIHAWALALTGGFAFKVLEFMKSSDAYSARSLVILGCMLVVIGRWSYVTPDRFHDEAG